MTTEKASAPGSTTDTETVSINNPAEITDEDFNNPFRNIELPALPQELLNRIGNNHLVTVAVEPKTMLLTWTHMTPKDNYIEKIKNSEKKFFDKFGVVDKNGNRQKITWGEYQNVKEDMPLYLATAQGSQNSLPQAANYVSTDNITSSSEKSSAGAAQKEYSGKEQE